MYAIMRAARAASTESLVLSVPFRPPSSVHPSTASSIAIMLAFAKFANSKFCVISLSIDWFKWQSFV